MTRASSRAAGSREPKGKETASSAGLARLSQKSASGGEPALESDVSSRDEVERVERGHKRQAVQTPATTRRCPVRQSPRNLAAAQRSSQRESVDEESCSLLLNKIPTELLENMLSYLARGPPDSSSKCCEEEGSSGGEAALLEAGSPSLDLPSVEGSLSERSTVTGCSIEPAPLQLLFTLCALTCRRWNKAVRSPQVLGKLSMVRFPLPAAAALELSAAGAGKLEVSRRTQVAAAGGVSSIALQAGDELLDARAENILRVASKAGNDGAQFLLGLYLSRQKTFALLCLACPTAGSPAVASSPTAAEGGVEQEALAQERRRKQEQLREAVLDTFDEGVELLRSAADLLHPNALYQLGMLAFGGTDVKLRSRLFGHDGGGGCGDCVLGEEHAELYWRRAAELGHLESRLIVEGEFRVMNLEGEEKLLLPSDAERRSWKMCVGNRLLSSAKRPQSSWSKARECSHEDCGMYTLLCEFKQCAGCASSQKKQRYCNRACQKRDWNHHRSSCGWFNV